MDGVPFIIVEPLIGKKKKKRTLLKFIMGIVFHRSLVLFVTTLESIIKYKITKILQWYGGARMTHTAEQNSIRATETTDIIASKHVIKKKRCRTLIGEAYFSEALL